MRSAIKATPVAIAALALGLSIPAVGSEPAPTRAERGSLPTVMVADDVFKPSNLEIKRGSKVLFKWSNANKGPHDVALKKGPDGVDKSDFQSKVEKRDYQFKPRFNKRGRYRLFCHIHPDVMKMEIRVKR